jgi:molybdate transport system permease protein
MNQATRTRRNAAMRWLFASAGTPLLCLLIVPALSLAQRFSLSEFMHQLSERNTYQAIKLSFITATITTVVVMIMGTPLAHLLARRQSRSLRILEVLIDLPTIFPPVVAGIALLLAFGRTGFIGRWLDAVGIELVFTSTAVIMAQTFVAAPFYIKSATVGLRAVSSETIEAASLEGADWFQTLIYVTIPMSWRSIFSGLALCWARAMGEFGATMIFAGNLPGKTQTMTLAVYVGFEVDLDQALTLAVILLSTSALVLYATRTFMAVSSDDD